MAVFALDIGTRKVAGILGELTADKRVRIIDAVVLEHEKRAMLDGQIHSIDEVSSIVLKIKNELESRNSIRINSVTTAVAGRSLHTETVSVETAKKGEVSREDIFGLETLCVKNAGAALTEKNKKDYFCVGYSIVYYELDGAQMKNIQQQTARESIGACAIVTFLPKIVFESMIAVLRNCGLKLTGLTLEPIAALSVTIPEDMRLLNLVLVDVGAGTSDIAVTEKGRITAYGMIPKAGDEITEQICNEFLTDFRQAEIIKRSVNEITGASGKDIFGNPFSVTYEEFCRVIGGKTNEVAKDVADEILALNGKQPRAVVMVGGGSGLRLLREMVAENLALPLNRVGCREPRDVLSLENLPETLAGAEGATPLGILETALYNRGLGFIEITLNGEKEYIINLDQKIKVIDSLIARGIELKSLYGKPGNALTFTLNGKLKIIRGSQGEHVKFFVNNLEKNLESEIVSGDVINMSPPKNGQDAVVTMRDIIPFESGLTVEINSKMEKIEPKVFVNGKEVGIEEAVLDRADITIEKPETVGQALLKVGFTFDNGAERDIIITIGGEPVVLKQRNYKLKINGQEGSFESPIRNLDKIEFSDKPSYYRIKDILNTPGRKKVTIMINKMPYELEAEEFEVYMNGRKTGEDEFIINGAEIEVKAVDDRMMLSHIFKTYPIDTQRAKGKMLDLRVNGEKAGYTTPIKSGDQVDIRFL